MPRVNIKNISEIVGLLERPNLNYKLYFSRKLSTGGYSSFSPDIDGQIFEDLTSLIKLYLNNFTGAEVTEYNPTGYRDGTIEKCNISYVGNFEEVLSSFSEASNVDIEIDPDNFTFYTLVIKSKDDNSFPEIRIFRRVTKFKKLHSKGIIARQNGHQLNKIESKLIGIDGEVDFISIGDKIFVLSHYSLERVFNLHEEFEAVAKTFLEQEKLISGIENYEVFKEDCLNDGRVRKTLAKMSNENIDLDKTYENYKNIIETISMFTLELEYIINEKEKEFKLKYEDKSQVMDIIRILRDSYYRSLINEKKGIDDK